MTATDTTRATLDQLQQRATIAGVAGLVACGVGWGIAPEQFFPSWLTAFLFWTGLSLGCFALLLLHHIFGAGWGFAIQRILEAGTQPFAVMAGFFGVLIAGLPKLYKWARPEIVATDEILQNKAAYLNTGFFIGRAVLYFALWIGVAWLVRKWSRQMDEGGSPLLSERLSNFGAPGLLIYGLTATFAAVDWGMSLDPHWFSTMFGLIFIAGQVLSALALCVLVLRALGNNEPLASVARPAQYHDLGNLMLAFTMIWAYLSFSQFLIIWSGNLPETIIWYHERSHGGWQNFALLLFVFAFAVPFALLLSRLTKRRIQTLAVVAALILAMRLGDIFWVVAPTFSHQRISVHWLDFAAVIGMGGMWLAVFARHLKSAPLIPTGDPRAERALAHGAEHH